MRPRRFRKLQHYKAQLLINPFGPNRNYLYMYPIYPETLLQSKKPDTTCTHSPTSITEFEIYGPWEHKSNSIIKNIQPFQTNATLLVHMPPTPRNSFKVWQTRYHTHSGIQKLKCLWTPKKSKINFIIKKYLNFSDRRETFWGHSRNIQKLI